jgi:hypothetical protein
MITTTTFNNMNLMVLGVLNSIAPLMVNNNNNIVGFKVGGPSVSIGNGGRGLILG